MSKPTIYYACTLPVRAGGELVNFQHVASLRRQGWRAVALLDEGARVALPSQPYPVPMVQWGQHAGFTADDWLVVPEVTLPASFAQLAQLPPKVVVHNQNPYYSFRGFNDIASMNDYPLAGGLCCSRYTRVTLHDWGSRTDWKVVRPFVLPHFAQAAQGANKKRQIAFMPRKRPQDARVLRMFFRALYPEWDEVPWVEVHNLTRPQVAQMLADSMIFASLSKDEGLGLPPLEAMAAGCLVCGFTGGGGAEYATSENGLWVEEGELVAFARAIARTLEMEAAEVERRVVAGRATVAAFDETHFDDTLQLAWQALLGERATQYRVPL